MPDTESRWICARARQVQQLGISGAAINTVPCVPEKPCNTDIWNCGWRFILEVRADGPSRMLKLDGYDLSAGAELVPVYQQSALHLNDLIAVPLPVHMWLELRRLLLNNDDLFAAFTDEITALEVELSRRARDRKKQDDATG